MLRDARRLRARDDQGPLARCPSTSRWSRRSGRRAVTRRCSARSPTRTSAGWRSTRWNHQPGLAARAARRRRHRLPGKEPQRPQQLGRALRAIHLGETVVAPLLPVLPTKDLRSSTQIDFLTARERETLAHIATGKSNDDIARQMQISLNSVKSYIRSAYRKTGVQSRSQAVAGSSRTASRRGLRARLTPGYPALGGAGIAGRTPHARGHSSRLISTSRRRSGRSVIMPSTPMSSSVAHRGRVVDRPHDHPDAELGGRAGSPARSARRSRPSRIGTWRERAAREGVRPAAPEA